MTLGRKLGRRTQASAGSGVHPGEAFTARRSTISLDGAWTLRQQGTQAEIPAAVPGCVHTDLLAARRIPDPFVADNEDKLRWIFEKNWVYRRMFEVPRSFLAFDRIMLCCEGLDTVAAIFLNGKRLAETDNMFRAWEFDVRGRLKAGSNTIEIRFESPITYIRKRQQVREVEYPYAPRQVHAFSQMRKAAYSFGWDWGVVLPTCGIWRSIRLEAFNTGRLTAVQISQAHSRGRVNLDLAVEAERTTGAALGVRTTLRFKGAIVASRDVPLRGRRANLKLEVRNPQLWWPNDMGPRNLYELVVELVDATGRVIDCQSRRIGLRTLNLVREKDRWGESFHFQVNGVPFYAKGVNWVPADALPSRMTPARTRTLLQSAADAHMNMVRVWGGGYYEPDDFYDCCDELGICVWQDFMFACAPYPIEVESFVRNTTAEMEQQVRRLRHHPSMALWCGNNEVESCGFVATRADKMHMSLAQYRDFFERRMSSIVARLDPQRDYWPTSPLKVRGRRYNPDAWIAHPERGDVHLWTVWGGRKPIEMYRESQDRFVSEFGFQSFPEPATVASFARPADHDLDSVVMKHHQRATNGNATNQHFLQEWFRTPRDFATTLWLSQIIQGVALKTACEHWRRLMPRNMGALIWQLNDTWPVASWSTVDYFGRWKAAHFLARRFFAPLLVSAVEDARTGRVEVHVTSDLRERAKTRLTWTLTDLEGRVLRKGRQAIDAAPGRNTPAQSLSFKNELKRIGPGLLLWLELAAAGQSVSRNLVLFAKPKHLELPDPQVTRRITPAGDGSFRVIMQAAKPALWTWMEIPGTALSCSDQFMHLEPGRPVEIRVTPEKPMTAGAFAKGLRVRSLYDTYRHARGT